MIKLSSLLLFVVIFCKTSAAWAIYGEDSRVDYFKLQDHRLSQIASAVAYQVEKVELRGWTFNRFWELLMNPLQQKGVCASERFSDHLALRNNCSWTLIGPRQLLSAGNCITDHYCSNDLYYFVFNFHHEKNQVFAQKHHRDNFYQCKKVIKRVFHPQTARSFVIIELEKDVKGITPVKLSKALDISQTDNLVVLGHPLGIPLKVALENKVYDQNESHFLINSDIPGETRGAAIINQRTLELEGILINGTKNFEHVGRGCLESSRNEDHEARELAIKASAL